MSATLLMVGCAEYKAGYFRKKLKHNVAKLRKENEGIYHAGEVTLSEVCQTDKLAPDLAMLVFLIVFCILIGLLLLAAAIKNLGGWQTLQMIFSELDIDRSNSLQHRTCTCQL